MFLADSRPRSRAFALAFTRLLFSCGLLCCVGHPCRGLAQETNGWIRALAAMPLPEGTQALDRSSCIPLMLDAFRSNDVVKALVFLPGATDEFYHFRRARAVLTNAHPTLADAVRALTSQTLILATYRAPFLLLHTWEDQTTPQIRVEHPPSAEKLRRARFPERLVFTDEAWGLLQPRLEKRLNLFVKPAPGTTESWHFYRHSLACFDLSGWESVEAISLAGMTSVTVKRRQVIFDGDTRPRWNRELKELQPGSSR